MGQKIQDRAERERREANELKQQVDMIRKGVEKIATGDLTMRFDASDNGALSQLTNHLNSMIEGLAAMSRQISEASISMNTTITEVQSAIHAQSSGATQQAASINETTSTLTEIKATANQTLEKAIALGKSAELTRLEGEKGAEVKALAEQSQQAAAQVHKILQDIQLATEKAVMVTEEGTKGVDRGVQLVEQTGEVVKRLAGVIEESAISSQQIIAAVRQEAVGVDQISIAMSDINKAVSQFVTATKQTVEAIGHLGEISSRLNERVATDTGITIDKLPVSGLLALLQEKRRKIMTDRLEIFSRYDVVVHEGLEKKIKDGAIPGHPAWEDLILLENCRLQSLRRKTISPTCSHYVQGSIN